ncbi:MAG: CopG family transcriptional regulator [Candidatus Micrarchaeota archaeon]|nr:CopG family transcriptional regulator [Candidatus Micrarchaeota archaeon]
MKSKRRTKKQEFTSISIPTTLFKKVEKHIEETGFPSVSGYVAYILRVLLTEGKKDKSDYEAELIRKRLRELGYEV